MTLALAAQMPALEVVLPLLAAPLCFLSNKRAWIIAFLAASASFLIAASLFADALQGGAVSYLMGGFPPPLGIEFRIDAANALMLLIVSGAGLFSISYALRSLSREINPQHQGAFYCCLLLCLSGLLGVVITNDAFNMFVFLEISSLSAYALIAFGAKKDPRALTAAYNYLILGSIGASFFVMGVGFLYAATGTLNMTDIAERIADSPSERAVRAGLAFIFTGLALKIALFPLHLWLPNAYRFAPTAAAVFLSAAAAKASVYALIRFLFSVFGTDFTFGTAILETLIMPLAIVGMFAASLAALIQTDLKRMFAYSSIAQISYVMLGLSCENREGLEAALLHLFNHALIKGAIFMALGCLAYRSGSTLLIHLRGGFSRAPLAAACLALACLSLVGIPLTAGFVSKWFLFLAVLEKGWWIAALAVAFSSLLAVAYVWRVFEAVFLAEGPKNAQPERAPFSMLFPLLILAGASLYFGMDTHLPISAASLAADILISPHGAPTQSVLP